VHIIHLGHLSAIEQCVDNKVELIGSDWVLLDSATTDRPFS